MARIRDVWAPNLEIEMRNIREAIERYPYIAMVRPALALVNTKAYMGVGHRIPWRRSATYWRVQVCL